jgi:surfactin synthase thioesterase subunit
MASKTLPTIVLIPGSFGNRNLYATFLDKLASAGFEAHFITLPSTIRRTEGPPPTLKDDADLVHSKVAKLVDEGKEVMLMAHSYGGMVATECAKGLVKPDRQAAGKSGGVVHVILIAALMPQEGESLFSIMKDVEMQGPQPDVCLC